MGIRDGIQHFNTRNAHLVRHPYNETVTLFFVHMIVRVRMRTSRYRLEQPV